jgi:insulysin
MEEKGDGNLFTDIIKSKNDKLDYGFKKLSNGLKVLLISDPETKKSSAAMCVNIGSLADKKDEQGLAHFCEHLLFMGNKKYPMEDEYSSYLTKNGGSANASTSEESTLFYFDVSNEAFDGALDRFAYFFISPIFNESSIEREIKAVDNEFTNHLNKDARRLNQIKLSEYKKESPFNHFSTGNLKTLSIPDIRDRLLIFYKKYYTSEIMDLCVYSNKSLKDLLILVENLFSLIPKLDNFEMPRYDEIKPYDETNLKYLYKIIPVKSINQITFEWFLPICDNYYYEKSLNFISEILGHEGPNTLTSSLNKDNLCNSLISSSDIYGNTFLILRIDISLTKKGFDNYKEVILRVLKYIKEIKNKEINKRFFDEAKQIRQINFDLKNKISPTSSTTYYVKCLTKFEPKDIISGLFLYYEYNEKLLRKYLDMITINNLNIYFLSKSFENECNLTEEYYGTKWCKQKLNITEEEINSYKCKDIFDYPPENKFIPRNFDIIPPPEKILKYPEIIKKNKNIEVWHLQDTIYKVPKVYLRAQFWYPEDLCNFSEVKLRILAYLLDSILSVELGEFIYMAESANLNFSFVFSKKVLITFGGYNDSLKEGMELLLNYIKNLDLNKERCKETLEIQQKEMERRVKNILLNESYKVNLEYLKRLINEPVGTPEEIINFFSENKITIEDVILYKNSVFKNSKSKWAIQGNISKESALEIVEKANQILEIDIDKEKSGRYIISRPVVFTKNYNYIFRKKCINPKETNSCLLSLYQTSLLNDKEVQYLHLTENFLKTKFYDMLRTKETLGYVVELLAAVSCKYYCIVCLVQSNSKTPEFCASRVRKFMKESFKLIKDISDEEFKKLIDSQLSKINVKDNNLRITFLLNWEEIKDETYKFDKKERNIEILKNCNKEEFIKFYEKYFIKEVAITDSEYVCEAHYEQNEKDIKEAKILEGENIKKRIICDTFEDFKACNQLGVIYNNPIFSYYNN